MPFEAPWSPLEDTEANIKRVYTDRLTIRSVNRGKITRAHLDIIRFVEIANAVINALQEESDHADL